MVAAGIKIPDVEIESVGTSRFRKAINRAKHFDKKHGWKVSKNNRQQQRCFLAKDKSMGFVISDSGDIEAVFSNQSKKFGHRKALNLLIPLAVAWGGRKLDCYGPELTDMYGRYGAKAHGRVKFDPEYAPRDWDGVGQPEVVAMSLPNTLDKVIKSYDPGRRTDLSTVPWAKDYDEMLSMRDKAMRRGSLYERRYARRANGLIAG